MARVCYVCEHVENGCVCLRGPTFLVPPPRLKVCACGIACEGTTCVNCGPPTRPAVAAAAPSGSVEGSVVSSRAGGCLVDVSFQEGNGPARK